MTADLASLLFRPNEGDPVRVPKLNLLRSRLLTAESLLVKKTGDIMSGPLVVSCPQGEPMLEAIDTNAGSLGSGGRIRLRLATKPTAAEDRLGIVHLGAVNSAGTARQTAAMVARATEDWGALAGEGTRLDLEVTANGAFGRIVVASLLATGMDVLGEMRCDTLRIDAAATAAAAVPSTHKVAVIIGGTPLFLLATT